MPWIQDYNGEELRWYNTDTGQVSNTDPNAMVQMAFDTIGNVRAGGTGFGASNPRGWTSAGSGEGQPNGYYWTAPNGRQFYIPPSLGAAGRSATNIFGTDKNRPDDALGVMIQAGYDEPTIRAMVASNPTAFSNVGIIEKDIPYWLQQARQQEEIGQRQNQESDTLGNLVRAGILAAMGATIGAGEFGIGPFSGGPDVAVSSGMTSPDVVAGWDSGTGLIGGEGITTDYPLLDGGSGGGGTGLIGGEGITTDYPILDPSSPAPAGTGPGGNTYGTGGAGGTGSTSTTTTETQTQGAGTGGTTAGDGAGGTGGDAGGTGGTQTGGADTGGTGGTNQGGGTTGLPDFGDQIKNLMNTVAGLTTALAAAQNRTPTADPSADLRALETERQGRVASARSAVNSAFSGFGDDYYTGIANAYRGYAMPQFEEQSRAARRALPASVATTQSSAYQRRAQQLETDIGRAEADIGRNAIEASNQRRGEIDSARQSLLNLADSSADASTTAGEAAARARTLAAPVSFSPLGDLFSKYMNDASTAAILRGQEQQPAMTTRPLLFGSGGRRNTVRAVA